MIAYQVTVYNDCIKWKHNGLLHHLDGPAVESIKNGYKAWYYNGQRHRADGPAVIYSNGDREWWFNGKLHREDGPAIWTAPGNVQYYKHGKLHRDDGPAVIQKYGLVRQFWVEGVEITYEQWALHIAPAKEMTVAEIADILGYSIKIIK